MFEEFDEWRIRYAVKFSEGKQRCIYLRTRHICVPPESSEDHVREQFKNETGDFEIQEIEYLGRNARIGEVVVFS